MNNTIKTVVIVMLASVVVIAVILNITNNKKPAIKIENKDNTTTVTAKEPIEMCYYRADKTNRGFYDRAWLKLSILDEKISGEFYNLPAESDSKVGDFTGSVGPLDQAIMARHADVWWNSRAEGMEVKEQLAIQFGDGSATVGFGEMIDRGDGVYVYKDASKLYWIEGMSQTDCDSIDEKQVVEQYIRDNIGKISTNKPVLGGTWYVISANINSATKIGEITYEDGHIQNKATFSYVYNKDTKSVQVMKFTVNK
ncbi:MAG: hypothetical protein WCW04_00505 [Candidatus Paceibacterota bacterium]